MKFSHSERSKIAPQTVAIYGQGKFMGWKVFV